MGSIPNDDAEKRMRAFMEERGARLGARNLLELHEIERRAANGLGAPPGFTPGPELSPAPGFQPEAEAGPSQEVYPEAGAGERLPNALPG